MKHKHSTKASSTSSSLSASSVSDPSVKLRQFDDKLQAVLNNSLGGGSKIGNFIINRILCSLDATNITNGEKIKYIKIIEQFVSKFVQEMDKNSMEQLQPWRQLYNLVLIREHLKKGEESVIKYLLNSKVFDENLFNPNRLNDDNNLTLLDLLKSLNDVLIDRSEIKKNSELIQWLKEKKGAKKSSEILQGKFNQEDYDKNIEKFKKELQECLPKEVTSEGGFKAVRKFENNRSKEFLECLDVILNNKRGEISQHIKLLLNKQQDTDHYKVYVHVLDKLLSEYYQYIDHDKYIKIIHSIVAKIPSDSLRVIHYEELIGVYFDKIKLKSFLTKEEEGLLDEYTNQLVTLIINSNADNSAKHYAYRKRFNYYKYKENSEKTILQETIEVLLELIKYADSTQKQEDLYRLLIALHHEQKKTKMFIKRENILKASAISMIFVISFVVLTNILVRRCINHECHQQNLIKLEEYHNIIRSLLVDKFNINYILSSNDVSDQISILKEHIRNHVFISKYHIPNSVYGKNDLPYITLQELLDILSNQVFKYNITINNHSIISNGVVEFQESLNKQYHINKDLTYNISIQISPNSYYTQQAISRVKQQILLLNIGSIFTILVLFTIILYLSYRDKKIKIKLNKLEADLTNSMEHSKNILLFQKINEEFTLKCYHYSKSSDNKKSFNISNTVNIEDELGYNSEYFPLPITTLESHNEINYHTIKLTPIILYLQSYYTGYTACYNSNIKLDIVSNIETLEVPFESEIFNQIMVSVLSNILYFNKNTERSRCVKLIFQNNLITFIGEGFSLDQNLAVRYSEKIFNDTANLYILNLGQIFILLKSFKINCQVTKNKYSTTIEIKLDNVPTELNTDTTQKAQIIKMNKYRKLNDLK